MKINEKHEYFVEERKNDQWVEVCKEPTIRKARLCARNHSDYNKVYTRVIRRVSYTNLLDEYDCGQHVPFI